MIAEPRSSLLPWLVARPGLYPWVASALTRTVVRRLRRRPRKEATETDPAIEVRILGFTPSLSPSLEGSRVLLRPFVRSDVEALQTLTFGDVSQAYRRCQALWTIVDRSSGTVAGYCGLTPMLVDDQQAVELGYSVVPNFRDRGVATEASQLVISEAFSRLGLPRLIALVEPSNTASRRVLSKCGFTPWRDARFFGTPVQIYERSHTESSSAAGQFAQEDLR